MNKISKNIFCNIIPTVVSLSSVPMNMPINNITTPVCEKSSIDCFNNQNGLFRITKICHSDLNKNNHNFNSNEQYKMDKQDVYYILGDEIMKYIDLKDIYSDSFSLKTKVPYRIAYTVEGEYFSVEDEKIGISCYGKTYSDLILDIQDNILANWEVYVKCDEDELSKGAIALRNRLLDVFEEIE